MFKSATHFNQPMGDWEVSLVTEIQEMFKHSSFDQPIGDWNVSSVTNMEGMFANSPFNQPVGDWDVSSVTKTDWMFSDATSFNHPIRDWNVSSVTNMTNMFNNASSLSASNKGKIQKTFSSNANWPYDWVEFVTYESITDANFQDALNLWFSDEANATYTYGNISDWNVSAVTNMSNAFKDRTIFNEDISGWNTSSVTNMGSMFSGASLFNQPIGDWNVSSVQDMNAMFLQAGSFDQNIGNWNTSSLSNSVNMFYAAVSFNQDIGSWNTSALTNMGQMFLGATAFNQDLKNWNTSLVGSLYKAFTGANAFNQDLSDWNISSAYAMTEMFDGASALSDTNKGKIHQAFSHKSVWPYNWSVFIPNQAPANLLLSHSQFAENLADGSIIGTFSAFDPDTNDTLSYWLMGSSHPTNQLFSLQSTNGVLRTATSFDYESNASSYLLSVKAMDSSGASTEGNFTIKLINDPSDHPFIPQALSDSNFQTAVNLWFDNQGDANATYGHIRDWNTSQVTNMSEAFQNRTTFNEDISGWDVSGVTNMVRIFYEASSFNQDISNWDISSVTTLNGAFRGADAFNQAIGNWNTSAVTDINYLFAGADSFNQNIGNWNISNVRSMIGSFRFTDSFNQDLSNWDTSSVENMALAFELAQGFNQDISDWNTSSVTNITDIFQNTSALSDTNKGKIHKTFSTNPNWPHDWSDYMEQDYQSPTGNYQSPEGNYTSPTDNYPSPAGEYQSSDGNYTSPSISYQTPDSSYQSPGKTKPGLDKNNTHTEEPVQVYIPIVQTFSPEQDRNETYYLSGKILFDGGSTITEIGIILSENIFLRNPIRIPSKEDLNTSNFSISYNDLLPGKTYYFKAYAINSAGENRGSVKKFKTAPKSDSTSWYNDAESLPAGWRKSAWLGAFRPSNHYWIYHAELGWLYPSPMPDGSLWLWNEKDGWRWTQQGVFPYLFRWRDSAWIYLHGQVNGRIIYYNYSIKLYE
jgi:surface protein